jgi:hypothetical protein
VPSITITLSCSNRCNGLFPKMRILGVGTSLDRPIGETEREKEIA